MEVSRAVGRFKALLDMYAKGGHWEELSSNGEVYGALSDLVTPEVIYRALPRNEFRCPPGHTSRAKVREQMSRS